MHKDSFMFMGLLLSLCSGINPAACLGLFTNYSNVLPRPGKHPWAADEGKQSFPDDPACPVSREANPPRLGPTGG